MSTKFEEFDPFKVITEEEGSETNLLAAAIAGVASGIIKIPEGVVSLGAELIDLGLDTNTAADVEKFFDKLNPFEEVAQTRAIGKLTEALTSIAIPGGYGFKLATNLADKALKAKKIGNYANLASPNVAKALGTASDLNRKAKTARFAAGVTGGAVGEAFVADVEDIGSIGDAFEAGPTQLTEVTDEGGREDAGRKLLNRVKFGSEAILTTPIVYGVGKGIKAAAQRGKRLEFSNSKLDQFYNKTFSALRARGAKPQEIFEAKMAEKGAVMSDTNEAMQIVKGIDRNIDAMFPTLKSTFSKSTAKEKSVILKEINDAMFSGKLDEALPLETRNQLTESLKIKGLSDEGIDDLFGQINLARAKFTQLIDMSSNAPKDVAELKGLLGERTKEYLGNTYAIFEDKSSLPFINYKPTDQAVNSAKELFKRYHRFANRNTPGFDPVKNALTDQEADTLVNNVLKNAVAAKSPKQLPFTKYINLTAGSDDVMAKKFFKQVVTRDINGKKVDQVIGEGSKIFKDLFGKIEDPRFSIYNGMARLSAVARRNELLENLAKTDTKVKADVASGAKAAGAGEEGFFFTLDDVKNLKAEKALPNQEIVALDDYLAPFFKDDFVVNPLQGLYTSKAIAEGLGDSSKAFKGLFEPREGATGVEQLGTWIYRNLILAPKGAAQVAKTILSPVTHFRNLFSATGFSASNGIFFENPKVVANAFKEAFGALQVGTRSAEGNARYQKLLRLGVVNSQVQLGDIKNLLKDVRFGENLNIDKPLASMGRKLFGLGARGAKKFMKGAEDFYTAEDDLFKITNYAVERSRLKNAYIKAGREFTEEFLDEEAANIVRNTVPNYAYVSDTVRALRRLPLGTFMSFPSEILRTTTNIAKRAIQEINDPALRAIGMKRLTGLTTVLGVAPLAFQKGFQAMYDVTNEELEAMRLYLPEWSKNSTILPIRDEETGELKYIDFSHGNAYDTAIRPINTLLINIQRGITDENVLMKGVMKGMFEAAGELASPFISEAIYTQALFDLIPRQGRTKDGRQIWTETQLATEPGQVISNSINHLAQAMMPFSYPTLIRIYQAAADKPSKRGEFFELPDELWGFAGYRAVKLDPVRSMGFKLSEYQKGIRESRRLFTGGDEGLLKGGPKTPEQILDRFIQANKAKFLVQKKLRRDLLAAQLLGAPVYSLRNEFEERQLSKDYNRLISGRFTPYEPSDSIRREFRQVAERIGTVDPYQLALPAIKSIVGTLKALPLDGNFDDFVTFDEFREMVPGGDIEEITQVPPLPIQPMPSPNIVGQAPQIGGQQFMTSQGLTPTELALLSPEEQQMRLRQRGLI
jgi:hypothetical protein